jgi:hypothetical protein
MGGGCPDNAAPGSPVGARRVWGGEGEGEGEVVEQQVGALGNPCSFLLVFSFAVHPAGVR